MSLGASGSVSGQLYMGQMLYKLAANDVQPHCMLEEVVLVINDKQSGPWRGCSSKADAIPLVWGLLPIQRNKA